MSAGRKLRKTVKYQLLYWLIKVLIVGSNIPSRKAWLSFCGWLGTFAHNFSHKTRTRMHTHLTIAFPEKSEREIKELVRKTFRMLGKNAGEILRASGIETLDELEDILITHGYENFVTANQKGRGVIFLTCHMGAFDLQVTNMALRGLNRGDTNVNPNLDVPSDSSQPSDRLTIDTQAAAEMNIAFDHSLGTDQRIDARLWLAAVSQEHIRPLQ